MDLISLTKKHLIRIAGDDGFDLDERLTAIDNIGDEDILADIAENDYFWKIREHAVSNIKNNLILREIASADSNCYVRLKALENIDDEKVLKELMFELDLERLKIKIISLLEDIEFLKDYARKNPCGEIADEVILRIRQLDSNELINILFNDCDLDFRIAVCRYIEYDGVLDALAFCDCPTQLKIEAVENIGDDEMLAGIILDNDDLEVVKAAIDKIDSSWLSVIVFECDNKLARREMVRRIYNHFVLQELALSDEDECVRYWAMYSVFDEKTAYDVAMNDDNRFVREMATIKIWDEDLLYDVVLKDMEILISNENDYEKLYGINKLLSAFVIEEINLDDDLFEVMYRFHDDNVAVKTLRFFNFRDILMKVIGDLSKENVLRKISFDGDINGIEAIDEIGDENLLTKIVVNSKIPQISQRAFKNIKNEMNLAHIVCNCNFWQIRRQAIKAIKDESVLGDVCCNSKFDDMVFAAMSRIKDEQTLIRVAYNTSDVNVRKYAASKITNRTVLKDLEKFS